MHWRMDGHRYLRKISTNKLNELWMRVKINDKVEMINVVSKGSGDNPQDDNEITP